MSLPDPIPDNAERFNVLDWYVSERVPSQFVPGRTAVIAKLVCPGCAMAHEPPAIDTTMTCGCGLSMQYDMAHLRVWRAETAKVPA